jgi:hypothetical protein
MNFADGNETVLRTEFAIEQPDSFVSPVESLQIIRKLVVVPLGKRIDLRTVRARFRMMMGLDLLEQSF